MGYGVLYGNICYGHFYVHVVSLCKRMNVEREKNGDYHTNEMTDKIFDSLNDFCRKSR